MASKISSKMRKWAAAMHYNKIGDSALQTKHWNVFQTAERMKAYHAQGYPNISSFFHTNGGLNFPANQGGMCCQRFEAKLGCLDSAAGSRTHLEVEEEEKGEEEEVVVIADKDWNSGTAPLRCEAKESSESKKHTLRLCPLCLLQNQ